jgi:hypothetical protein
MSVTRTLTVATILLACCLGFVGFAEARTTAASTAQATADERGLRIGGKPFFPVMLINECAAADVARARALGVNLIVNEECPALSLSQQLTMVEGQALAILPLTSRKSRGSGLAGWSYPDEPEGNGWTPTTLAKAHPYPRGNNDGLIGLMTTGGGFFAAPYRRPQIPESAYAGFAQMADFAGFDLYPLGHCQSDLTPVYEAQREFVALAKGTPTFQWIETGPIEPTYCGGFWMMPAELRAEVWLAIAGGARGIGYFTHTWSPQEQPFDVTPAIQHEMWRTDSLLAAVRPGLVGRTLPSGADSPAIKLVARSGGGRTYIFAVNAQRTYVKAKLHVPALHNGRLQVFGEKRSLTVSGGDATDLFGPLAVHVYVQSN